MSVPDRIRQKAIQEAKDAFCRGYCPYSEFPVGAALVVWDFDSWKIVSGCNVENSVYGLGQCAERTAMCTAINQRLPWIEFREMFIYTNGKYWCYPCGACLQVMSEFNPEMRITLLKPHEEMEDGTLQCSEMELNYKLTNLLYQPDRLKETICKHRSK